MRLSKISVESKFLTLLVVEECSTLACYLQFAQANVYQATINLEMPNPNVKELTVKVHECLHLQNNFLSGIPSSITTMALKAALISTSDIPVTLDLKNIASKIVELSHLSATNCIVEDKKMSSLEVDFPTLKAMTVKSSTHISSVKVRHPLLMRITY